MTRMVMSGGLHRRRKLFQWGVGVYGCQGTEDRSQGTEDRRQRADVRLFG